MTKETFQTFQNLINDRNQLISDRIMLLSLLSKARKWGDFENVHSYSNCCTDPADDCPACQLRKSIDEVLQSNKSALNSLSIAQHLFKIGHDTSPIMIFSSNGPDGYNLSMKFKSLSDGQNLHSAFVKFFTSFKLDGDITGVDPVVDGCKNKDITGVDPIDVNRLVIKHDAIPSGFKFLSFKSKDDYEKYPLSEIADAHFVVYCEDGDFYYIIKNRFGFSSCSVAGDSFRSSLLEAIDRFNHPKVEVKS